MFAVLRRTQAADRDAGKLQRRQPRRAERAGSTSGDNVQTVGSGERRTECPLQWTQQGPTAGVIGLTFATTAPKELTAEDRHSCIRPPTCSTSVASVTQPGGPSRSSRDRCCNQLRQKIGVVYGNPETTTGGNALKFYCSVRLDIRRKKPIKRGDETIGSECKVKVVKNKLAPPFREADFEILYGTGVNKLGELVDTAEKLGLVEKSGTWYSYEGAKIGQGRDKVLAHLDEHPAIQQQLREALVKQARLASITPTPVHSQATAS